MVMQLCNRCVKNPASETLDFNGYLRIPLCFDCMVKTRNDLDRLVFKAIIKRKIQQLKEQLASCNTTLSYTVLEAQIKILEELLEEALHSG